MLKKRNLEELQHLAISFFRDHGDKLIEEERHFMLFSAMADQVDAAQAGRM